MNDAYEDGYTVGLFSRPCENPYCGTEFEYDWLDGYYAGQDDCSGTCDPDM